MIHGMDTEKGSSSTIRASSYSLMEFDEIDDESNNIWAPQSTNFALEHSP